MNIDTFILDNTKEIRRNSKVLRIIENRTGSPKGLLQKTEEVIKEKTGY